MTSGKHETDPSEGFTLPPPPQADQRSAGLAFMEHYPQLLPLLTRAVDELVTSSTIDRDHDSELVDDLERAAGSAALTTYERMAGTAVQASDMAAENRRDRARSVAATAETVAERVTQSAAEVHNVEEAQADRLADVAANTASELATRVGPGSEEEQAASVAAAVVVKAVSEAAAEDAGARARAASDVAQAAAKAAADVADEAASTASAVELGVITAASARYQNGLEACYESAAAAVQGVLAYWSDADRDKQPAPPELHRKPA